MKKNQVEDKGGKKKERRREPRIKVETRVKIRLKTRESEEPEQAKKEELWAFTSRALSGWSQAASALESGARETNGNRTLFARFK